MPWLEYLCLTQGHNTILPSLMLDILYFQLLIFVYDMMCRSRLTVFFTVLTTLFVENNFFSPLD